MNQIDQLDALTRELIAAIEEIHDEIHRTQHYSGVQRKAWAHDAVTVRKAAQEAAQPRRGPGRPKKTPENGSQGVSA